MKVFSHPNVSAYTGFIYIWMNTERKKFYVGSHRGSIDDGYIGSGTLFKKAYEKNPSVFKRRILQYVCGTHEDILLTEEKWLSLITSEEMYGKKYYNCTRNTTYIQNRRSGNYQWITDGIEEKRLYENEELPDDWYFGRSNYIKQGLQGNPGPLGKLSITDGVISKFINPDDDIPDGWYIGKDDFFMEKMKSFVPSQEKREAISKTLTGRKHSEERIENIKSGKLGKQYRWFTNGKKEKLVASDETPPSEWWLGRCSITSENQGTGSTGMIKITDGTRESFIQPDDPIPVGWYRGRADSVKVKFLNNPGQADKFVIHNSIEEKFHNKNDPIPDGWVKGRISSSVRGKVLINNGIESKYIMMNDPIPDGWVKGRKSKRKDQ